MVAGFELGQEGKISAAADEGEESKASSEARTKARAQSAGGSIFWE